MLEFHDIELSDMEKAVKALRYSDKMMSEFSFANNYAWSSMLDLKICFYNDFYIAGCFGGDAPEFLFPSGQGDIADAVAKLREYSEHCGAPLRLLSCEEKMLPLMEKLYGGSFTVESLDDVSDYIFSTKDETELKGHKKRKWKRFNKEFEGRFVFRPIENEEDCRKCISFTEELFKRNESPDESAVHEQLAVKKYFDNFRLFGMEGIILEADGVMMGYTAGTPLNSDTFDVNLEKTDRTYSRDLSAVLEYKIAEKVSDRFRYLNCEEDLGIPGLRYAKTIEHPCMMLKKYDLTFK
ncbi:MAG: DUF2156 domain-containing protein [Huintestinicola sp.]